MRNKMDDKYAKEYTKLHENRKQQFNHYKEKDDWHHEPLSNTTKPKVKPKPDPATVEAALRLEEELWAS
jgi:hypothetical protein